MDICPVDICPGSICPRNFCGYGGLSESGLCVFRELCLVDFLFLL